MTRSHKPLLWLPFAAGGTLAALVLPGLLLVTLLASVGALPDDTFSYSRVLAFTGHWLGALVTLGVLVPILWHAAHRLRMTVQDLGVRNAGHRRVVARICYGLASGGTLVLLYALIAVLNAS